MSPVKFEATCIDPKNGVNCATDLIGNSGAVPESVWMDDEGQHWAVDQDTADWWTNYLSQEEMVMHKTMEAVDKLGVDDVYLALFQVCTGDILDDQIYALDVLNDLLAERPNR